MKKPAPDPFANTTEHSVAIEGVRVNFRLDAKGKPLSLSTGLRSDDAAGEREAKMAIDAIKNKLALAAAVAAERHLAEAAEHVAALTATARSTGGKVRAENARKAARKHWSTRWLRRAHDEAPDLGAERLALMARSLVARHKPKLAAEKRAEITEYRARLFLKGHVK